LEDKCGGAVEKKLRMLQGVNFRNTKKKEKMKRMRIRKIKRKINLNK